MYKSVDFLKKCATIMGSFVKYVPIIFVVFYLMADNLIPNSYWFVVARVHVSDSIVGEAPKMIVARSILRPFRGHWIATVKKAQDETEKSPFYTECTAEGNRDYRPETVLPNDLDLDWWTDPRKCNLKPGSYIVDTSWIFHFMFFERTVRAVSNVFVIKALSNLPETLNRAP